MKTEYKVVKENGNTHWYNLDDKFHRTDGPAVEYADGSKHWFLDGKRHRTDGPAVENTSDSNGGSKHWYIDGKRHRTDGPAMELSNGTKSWYLDDKKLTEEEFRAQTNRSSCDGKVVEIEGKKYKLVEDKSE